MQIPRKPPELQKYVGQPIEAGKEIGETHLILGRPYTPVYWHIDETAEPVASIIKFVDENGLFFKFNYPDEIILDDAQRYRLNINLSERDDSQVYITKIWIG